MTYECKFEDKIIEMHGDIKTLVSEVRAMNGDIKGTKTELKEHEKESDVYRSRITTVWTVLMTIKWLIFLLFGSGIIWKLVEAQIR